MVITIKKEAFDELVAYANSKIPEEACGLIAGFRKEEEEHIEKVYYLTNEDHSNEHFSMAPKEQLNAVIDMRKNGYVYLGNWHSHPETPSRPSQEDIRLAYDGNAAYLILSLMEKEHPVLNAFHIVSGNVTKEELRIL